MKRSVEYTQLFRGNTLSHPDITPSLVVLVSYDWSSGHASYQALQGQKSWWARGLFSRRQARVCARWNKEGEM